LLLPSERSDHVPTRKDIVDRYIEGFRCSDHDQILSCLTDDVVWELHGHKTIQGKGEFDAEIESDGFEGSPTIVVDRMIEEGDSVVAVGGGSVTRAGGDAARFVFCEVFRFDGDAIRRLDTFHVWLE
jgi:ketosteroid isomerase-like protein